MTLMVPSSRFASWCICLALALTFTPSSANAEAAPQRVVVPSLDRDPNGQPVMLIGHWSPAALVPNRQALTPGGVATLAGPESTQSPVRPRGAVLMLHGCSGPYEAGGRLAARMREYTNRLLQRGWSVLVLDSLTTRGERELCTQRLGTRKVTQMHRRLDAWGGLTWLSQQAGVDAQRLGLMGWSNGGSTVLAAIEADRLARRPADVPLPAFAVAYYPGCAEVLQGGQVSGVPLLMQLGQADDWTPAQTCVNWAERVNASAQAVRAEVVLYPGAHHGFDGEGPVRLRADVPNGVNRGQGVHVGGDPVARRESLLKLEQWLNKYE